MRKNTVPKFLATFNENPNQTPPVQPVQVVPVDSLGRIIDLAAQRAVSAARQEPPAAPAAPPPQPRVRVQNEEPEPTQSEIARLRRELRESNERQQQLALDTYRLQAIQRVRAAGQGLIENLVWGSTQAEIDQAIRYSVEQYNQMRLDWERETAARAAQAPQQVAPPAPVPAPAAPVAAQPAPQQPQTPVGTVQQQIPPAALPGYYAPDGMQPTAQPQQQTTLDVRQFTTPDSVRNGTYGQNRQALMRALQQAAGTPTAGVPYSLSQAYNVAPPLPAQAPRSVDNVPAMQANVFAGVQMPQVRPQGGTINHPPTMAQPMNAFIPGVTPNYNPSPIQRQAPQPMAFGQAAPQPVDIDAGAPMDANAVSAARAAAQQAIMAHRQNR